MKLSAVEELDKTKRIVALCKHLCGAATDFALRAIENYEDSVEGLLLAPCCHHRCTYSDYVGKAFLTESGFTIDEWPALKHVASWAVCGFEKAKSETPHCANEEQKCPVCALSIDEKEKLGRLAKLLLEVGRAKYVERKLMMQKVSLFKYVDESLTPENVIIVARRKVEENK